MLSGYNSNKEDFFKLKMEEQTVPSAGFSPQPEYMSADCGSGYYGVASQQQQQQPAPPPLQPQPSSHHIGGGCLDSFDLSLLGDSYDDRDMATVPSPSSWPLLGSLEPNTWQQMSFYAASPQEQARAFSPDCTKPQAFAAEHQHLSNENNRNNNNYSGGAAPQAGSGGASEMLHQLSSEDEMVVTCAQNNILLRQCLEDNTFIEKYNFKPLDLPITNIPNVNNNNNEGNAAGATSGATGVSSPALELNQIEPVLSLAYEMIISDSQATCRTLAISPDPMQWSVLDVQSWLCYSLISFSPERAASTSSSPSAAAIRALWNIDGERLCSLTEEEFRRRDPIHGEKICANLELLKMWKCSGVVEGELAPVQNQSFDLGQILSASANLTGGDYSGTNSGGTSPTHFVEAMKVDGEEIIQSPFANPASVDTPTSSSASSASSIRHSDDDDEEEEEDEKAAIAPITPASAGKSKPSGTKNGAHIHLWQFLKELLTSGQQHGSCIRWLDQSRGVFKIEDSVRVARLWGIRKNRPAMNYDKLSRSIRQYYRKGIMRKTERSQRLVYQFCHPYGL